MQADYQRQTLNAQIPVFWKLFLSIALCELTGFVSSLLSSAGMSPWFESLNKPIWNPPASVFLPVWIVLYLMMGIALGLVWNAHTEIVKEKTALCLFAIQLFLNFWWSIIFFRFHLPGWAFVELIVLIVFVLATLSEFKRINKTAGWLLIPYVCWICFAAILNAAIWYLNP